MAGGLLSRHLPVEDHPGVIENAIAEFAVCGEAGVVHVVDSIASQRVTAGVGASSASARFVMAAIGQKLVTDEPVFGNPHTDILVLRHVWRILLLLGRG